MSKFIRVVLTKPNQDQVKATFEDRKNAMVFIDAKKLEYPHGTKVNIVSVNETSIGRYILNLDVKTTVSLKKIEDKIAAQDQDSSAAK